MTDKNSYSDGNMKADSGQESGSEEFGRLYESYLPGIFRFVYYRVGDKPLSEDLTSEIFEKALMAFNRYDSRKASFSTWIYTIARNTLTDYFRKQARQKKLSETGETDVPSMGDTIEEQLTREEESRLLHQCLRKLKTKEQEIISLKFSSGMTNREIALVTGISETNAGTILCRALRKLRDEFTGRYTNG